jgi:predicted Rdx family selenoprotein
LAEALVTAFKPVIGKEHPIEQIILIPAGNGRFEVTIDDELVYSKAATGEHTTNEYILQKARVRLLK